MTALVAVTAPSPSEGCLLADYRAFVAGLEINPDTKRVRRRAAEQLAAAHPDLHAWMRRPTPARLVDLRRSGAWPFVTWLFVEGRLQPDLDLLLAKLPGDLFRSWQQRHPHDVARLREAAKRLEWSANWTRDVTAGLSLVGLWAQATLDELDDDVLAAFATAIEAAPAASATARAHNHARLLSLHQACYQLRICQRPPRKRIRGPATLARRCEAIPQPEIRRVALRYLETIAPTLRPGTVAMRTDNLIVFAEYLASAHPEVVRLTQLQRAPHIEGFLVWNHGRPWRGRVARDRPVVASVSHGTVVDLRMFFDHLAIWGWAERPPGRLLLLPSDTGKLPRPLPRALPPDIDRALIGAVRTLDDLFVRCGLLMLRGTGLRIGELLDLELDCLWDTPSHGSWLRVPLGKLDTERMVPLDADTLAALDAWMARRGPPSGAASPTRRATHRLPVRRTRHPLLRLPATQGPGPCRRDRRADRHRPNTAACDPASAPPHICDRSRQRRHVPASVDGAVGACDPRDDLALCTAGKPHRACRLRHRHGQRPATPATDRYRSTRADRCRPCRMAALRDAQDPRRSRLLLPQPGPPGLVGGQGMALEPRGFTPAGGRLSHAHS
jgi:site-specific recombinase XerD